MQCNSSVSGGRWRCASCELFVSYQELQLCGLTQEALQKFGNTVSSQRDRVELRADGTYQLLQPNKLRYGNKKRTTNGSGGSGAPNQQVQSAIEEIVID